MAALVGLGAAVCFAAPRARGRVRDGCTGLWGRGLSRILGLRVHIEGAPPPRGALVVSNHTGYVDVFLLGAAMPCTFVSRGDVARWPLIGLVCRMAGVLFVDRQRRADTPRAARALDEALVAGRTVVLFPEGTSSSGEAVLPFRSALLDGAARSAIAVRVATLAYRTLPGWPPASTAVAWHGDAAFPPHLWTLAAMPRVDAYLRFLPAPVTSSDRKKLASELWTSVSRELADLRATLVESAP
ncbi:MAG: lysophospholipid acyltransferase family protein [Acidobacteriota bacterium]